MSVEQIDHNLTNASRRDAMSVEQIDRNLTNASRRDAMSVAIFFCWKQQDLKALRQTFFGMT